MTNTLKILIIICTSLVTGTLWAQSHNSKANIAKANDEIYNANQQYQQQQYLQSFNHYNQALKSDPTSYAGNYNAGNAAYNLGKFDTSRTYLNNSLQSANSKKAKANAYHNIGNTYMKQRKWQEAIDAYENALRNDPNNMNTKYNLAYAQKMKKNNKGGGGKNNQQKNNQNQQNKQDQNKQQNKQNKQDQNQQQNQQNKQDQNQQQQPSNSKLSKQQADKILNALQQEEKKLQNAKKEKQIGSPTKPDKDW